MKGQYVKAQTFQDFCTNQDNLIDILNHNMTKLSENIINIVNDVSWIKKLLFWIIGIFGFIFIAGILSIIKGG